MARTYNHGMNYTVSLNARDISNFRSQWPASGLHSLHRVAFQFDKRNGDLVDMACNGRSCDRFDGHALLALSNDAQAIGKKKLGLAGARRRR